MGQLYSNNICSKGPFKSFTFYKYTRTVLYNTIAERSSRQVTFWVLYHHHNAKSFFGKAVIIVIDTSIVLLHIKFSKKKMTCSFFKYTNKQAYLRAIFTK